MKQKQNDLFYTCSLIDYIAKKTKNVRADIVNQLGKERIEKIDDYNSSVYYENPSYLFECYEENKILQEKSAILSAKTGVQKNGKSDL